MSTLFWIGIHPSEREPQLRAALAKAGFRWEAGAGRGTCLLVVDRPDPRYIPSSALEILWWVKDATPEEASEVLARRPGWVLRQSMPLESALTALQHVRDRDLGSEGWLRQMLHLATLDELLRLVLVRAEQLSGAEGGAIWVRQDDILYQRCGEGFAEAPLSLQEAECLVREGRAWPICPDSRMGILRLKNPKGDPTPSLAWIQDVKDLLVNAWNLEQSQALSFRDDLTVALNRRALEVDLPRIIREAAARNDSVALLFLDVDNLKLLNSRFGHPVGSKVLSYVAMEAQRTIRAQDRLYRYGGDEFCVVISGTSVLGAGKMGDRLVQCLAERAMRIGETEVPVSVSIGIAVYPFHADGAEQLVEQADRALFRAKSEGKGRVVVA
ncbi:MAG: GGDEF domain-containing protein [Firmicutes bacterium]|nr:GGDEF domain-containing protein [Bacillota bacterium]